jgi:hypothetical protein
MARANTEILAITPASKLAGNPDSITPASKLAGDPDSITPASKLTGDPDFGNDKQKSRQKARTNTEILAAPE